MALSPISLSSIANSELSQEPVVKSELKNVRLENSILTPSEYKGTTLLLDNICSELKSSDNILMSNKNKNEATVENEQQKKNENKIKDKNTTGSNSVNNKKKAQGQIIALSLTTIIGAVLAPITGGMSLLPTAFLVIYGNAAAIAMYGGSRHFLNDIKKPQEEEIAPEATPLNTVAKLPPSPFHLPPGSSIERDNLNPFGNDSPDCVLSKPKQFNKQIIDEKVEDIDTSFTDGLIADENMPTIENQPQSLFGDVLESQLIGDNKIEGDKAILQEAMEQLLRTPIPKSMSTEQNLIQANFSTPIKKLLEEKGINAELNPNCVVSDSIYSSDHLQVFAIKNMPDIGDNIGLSSPENDKNSEAKEGKKITAPMEYLTKPAITSNGVSIRMRDNYQREVMPNVMETASTSSPKKTTAPSPTKDSPTASSKQHQIAAPIGYLIKPAILTSSIRMSYNFASGPIHNATGMQLTSSPKKSTAPSPTKDSPTASSKQYRYTLPITYLAKPAITSNVASIRMSGNDQREVMPNVMETASTSSPKKSTAPSPTKDSPTASPKQYRYTLPITYLAKPAILTSSIRMSYNFASGPIHNATGMQLTSSPKKSTAPSPTKDSPTASSKQYRYTLPITYLAKPAITNIGTSISMNSNFMSGENKNNLGGGTKNHSENLNTLAHSYLENTGINKPMTLMLLNRSLAIPPVNQEKLDYITKK